MPKPAPVFVDPLEALRGEVADLSRRRVELRGAREALLAVLRPPGEVRPSLTMLVERAAAQFEPPLGWLAQRHGELGGVLEHLLPSTSGRAPPLQPFALLCWVAPELVRAALERDLEAAYARLPAPAPERARRLAEIEARLGEAERAMATAYWSALDRGVPLEPPDVPGAVLIGLEALGGTRAWDRPGHLARLWSRARWPGAAGAGLRGGGRGSGGRKRGWVPAPRRAMEEDESMFLEHSHIPRP